MPWLEATHPELADRYVRLYPRGYAPKADQQRIADRVHAALDRHGFRPEPRPTADPGPEPDPEPEEPDVRPTPQATQLPLL